MRSAQLVTSFTFVLLLSGCLLNDVSMLSRGSVAPDPERAVVIYGLGVEGNWRSPKFAVQLDEYDVERQRITGNCSRFNRMQTSVLGTPGPVEHFVFDVRPGNYVYSQFNGVGLSGGAVRFEVPAGQTVYLGDFMATRDQKVVLRRDADTVAGLRKSFPVLHHDLLIAEPKSSGNTGVFVCMP